MELLRGAGIFALLTIFIGFTPLLMAVVYVMRPTERNLALMRPASLAGIFGALCGVVGGLIVILRGIGVNAAPIADVYPKIAVGFAEALVPVFVCFGCLTIAWLLVALGMRRQSA
jgi:hypothetical protein